MCHDYTPPVMPSSRLRSNRRIEAPVRVFSEMTTMSSSLDVYVDSRMESVAHVARPHECPEFVAVRFLFLGRGKIRCTRVHFPLSSRAQYARHTVCTLLPTHTSMSPSTLARPRSYDAQQEQPLKMLRIDPDQLKSIIESMTVPNPENQVHDMTDKCRNAGMRIFTMDGMEFADDGESIRQTHRSIYPRHEGEESA